MNAKAKFKFEVPDGEKLFGPVKNPFPSTLSAGGLRSTKTVPCKFEATLNLTGELLT